MAPYRTLGKFHLCYKPDGNSIGTVTIRGNRSLVIEMMTDMMALERNIRIGRKSRKADLTQETRDYETMKMRHEA